MTQTRIYHWKHGWIPLDHQAAMSHAKGNALTARRFLAESHAAGHAHASVVTGTFGGGTHVRGLQPVAAEHLPRQRHITAAFDPGSRRFSLLDSRGSRIGLSSEHDGKPVTAAIPEHLADHLHGNGYKINAVKATDAGKRIIAENKAGDLKSFAADGSDIHRVDPHVVEPSPTAVADAPSDPRSEFHETHTISPSHTGHYMLIKPVSGFGGSDVINATLGEHIMRNDEKVINYQRRLVTTVDRAGVVKRYKADGSNLVKPVIVRKAGEDFRRKDIAGWTHVPAHEALNGNKSAIAPTVPSIKVSRAYVKGNKRILIEPKVSDAQAEAFLTHVDAAITATDGTAGHLPVTFHVPSNDRQFASRSRQVLGYVYRGDSTRVHINPQFIRGERDTPSTDGGFHSDAAGSVHPATYTITHELGHIVDNANHHTHRAVSFQALGRTQNMTEGATSEAEFHRAQMTDLSGYGRTKPVEGYAEAFAQHHLRSRSTPGPDSGAHTRSSAAYAARYGWH